MAVMYTQLGEELICDYIDGTKNGASTNYIGSGTGAGSYVKGDTALKTEVSEARVAASKSQPAVDKNQWQATQTYSGAGKTITNAAACEEQATSTVIIGADGLSIAVVSGDSIQFTFTLEQT
jgi:hypothetical protein